MTESEGAKKAGLKSIGEFFEYESLAQFRKDWMALEAKDKEQLAQGIGDGTLTY